MRTTKRGLFGMLFAFLERSWCLKSTTFLPWAPVNETTLNISSMEFFFWSATSPIVQTCMKCMCTTFSIITFHTCKTQIWTWSKRISNIGLLCPIAVSKWRFAAASSHNNPMLQVYLWLHPHLLMCEHNKLDPCLITFYATSDTL
jgi:hypothetical protein